MLINNSRVFVPARIAVLTILPSISPHPQKATTPELDEGFCKRIIQYKHKVVARKKVRNDRQEIIACLDSWIDIPDIDVIITIGGTGFTGHDIAIEAHRSMYEKEIESFAVQFHMAAVKRFGNAAMQLRTCAGLVGTTCLFALPGAIDICIYAWDAIIRYQLDNRYTSNNFLDILQHAEEE